MSLFFTGLLVTLAAPVLMKISEKMAPGQLSSWLLSMGYASGAFGPFMLVCSFADLQKVLSILLLGGLPLWAIDRYLRVKRATRLASGFLLFMVDLVPIALFVLIVRSYTFEAYKVPTSSMRPTLEVGDQLLVSKFSYGLRNPLTNEMFFETGKPKIGDIAVFQFPLDKTQIYVKRIIGTPGYVISFSGDTLSINGIEAKINWYGQYSYADDKNGILKTVKLGKEIFGDVAHSVLSGNGIEQNVDYGYPLVKGCTKTGATTICKVPSSSYFVLGDNRADSLDSRYWGFVNSALLRGRVEKVLFKD